MSTPLSAAGYQWLRDLVEASTAIYIELLDTTDTPIVRLPISDSRVAWSHSPGAQRMILTAVVTGADGDIPLGTVIKSSALYKVASGGSMLDGSLQELGYYDDEDVFRAATTSILAPVDEATINHRLEIPEVV